MTSESEYKDFLKGKRVALVGPGKTVCLKKQGELIDSYDVVVRLNDMLKIPNIVKQYIGYRTDVIYSTLDGNPHAIINNLSSNSVKYASSSYPKEEWFFEERMQKNISFLKSQKSFKTIILPSSPYFDVKRKTNSRPNTGFSAIIDLLSSELSELYITGIDFYRSVIEDEGTAYMFGYNCQWTNKKGHQYTKKHIESDGPDVHDPDASYQFFKENYYKDSRVKTDAIFTKYLSNSKYDSINQFYCSRGN